MPELRPRKVLVTGGAGFIGSAVVRELVGVRGTAVVNVDLLTYAGSLKSLEGIETVGLHVFENMDIRDVRAMMRVFEDHAPDAVIHLAAESHVDRSINGPLDFVQTNIVGTASLLEASREYWSTLDGDAKNSFRFLHVSTDEVFGDLGPYDARFTEDTSYRPSSPYSASKAASDHLVRAWHRTYGLPTLITNCSNNYGPRQHPEKLIPLTITRALEGRPLPVYGDGKNVRDWLYVEDHARALADVLSNGDVGETYAVGAERELTNIEIVRAICRQLDKDAPHMAPAGKRFEDLITFVEDRAGHDRRYAIDPRKLNEQLGWKAQESFESGLAKTVHWYMNNTDWSSHMLRKTDSLEIVARV